MKSKPAALEAEESSLVRSTRQRPGDRVKGSDSYRSTFDQSALTPT